MTHLDDHMQDAKVLQQDFKSWLNRRASNQEHTSLSSKKRISNTMRKAQYKQHAKTLNMTQFDRVLDVDKEKMTATVEPLITMEKLFYSLKPYGLMLLVTPEFRGITVGGAINGGALESSSYQWGQFNDTCQSFEIMLGNKEIVKASKNHLSDLFYGVSGCYGSMGILLSSDMQLTPFKPYVLLDFHCFSDIDKAVDFMKDCTKSSPDFIEALLFTEEHAVVVQGNLTDSKKAPLLSLKSYHSPWYYQIIRSWKKDPWQALMTTEDYLFRHDRAAFWMGGYALHTKLLFSYILNLLGGCPDWLNEKMMPSQTNPLYNTRDSGPIFRSLFGWMMGSQRLYRFLHSDTEDWFAKHFVIQDYYMPYQKTSELTKHVLKNYGITPIWLCPMKATTSPQIFSAHYIENGQDTLLFDVGVYGIAKDGACGSDVSYALDKKCHQMGGKKMLYGYSFYDKKEFWDIYSHTLYTDLRKKYFAEDIFVSIDDKVLEKAH